ncbi:MAG TPA: CHAT domain-containing protein, partial [Bryocella sp.]|nr:CHAT domain-containing protein [Bryocella sp.]
DRILSTSWDSHVAKIGMRYTLDLISQSAQFFYNNDAPERCLRLLVETRPLFEAEGDERKLIDRWILLLSCLSKIAKLPPAAREGPAATCREHLVAIAGKENWGPGRMAAGLLWLANLSERTNEEASGLEFLAEASRLAPLLTADLKDMIDYQHVLLWMGRGVNGVNAQQWGQAVHDYAASLSLALQFKSNDIRTDLLARIDDVAGKGPDTALPVAAGLIPKSLKIERLMGEPGGRWLRQLTKHTLAGIDKSTDPEVLSLLCQLGKGSRFAASLAAGACYQWKDDSEAERLLGLIAATEADLKSRQIAAPDDSDPDLDDSVVLCAYGEVVNPDAEDSPWQRLFNLQRSFDSHVINQLLSYAGDETGWYLHLPDIQASLDSRTVLLNFYLGATARKTVAVSAVAITRDEVRAGVVSHELPDGLVNMKGSKISVSVHPLARAVVNVRTEIAYSPGPGRGITPEGEQALTSDVRGFFGYLLEYLQEARSKGKDHLCIVPHGPLHFYPFHLLQDAGKPLAENMIVTYLPNLALLLAPRGQPSVFRYRARPLSALGLTFQEVHAFGLDELPQSAQESASIADLFQTKPVLEQAATEEAMRDALLNSRYVHLSTHGAHNISAPAFQCLFLAPAGENDGRLCAHEVLKLDLRGLEMLTLSACETALGRFDEADNLRGLPSAFLQAGVATILGTLWPVAAEPAEHFFTQLYANVQHGMDRRDAFYQAQQETRKAFPVYRDWGAFYYIGTWR